MIRGNRAGAATVTLVAGVAAGVWQDPDTPGVPTQVQLEYIPQFYFCQRIAAGGGGQGQVRMTAVTANGFTLTSSDLTDTGTFNVCGICRAEDVLFGG